MEFKERLHKARKAKELSLERLGELLGGLAKQTLSHWEKGRYEPNISQIQRLCEVLGCSADWLLLGKNPEGLSPDAIEQGKFYASLSADGKKKWKTMRLLIVDAAADHIVEKRMPVTRKREEKEEK